MQFCWELLEDFCWGSKFHFFSSLEQTLHRYSLFITFDKIMNKINILFAYLLVPLELCWTAHKAHKPFEVWNHIDFQKATSHFSLPISEAVAVTTFVRLVEPCLLRCLHGKKMMIPWHRMLGVVTCWFGLTSLKLQWTLLYL